MEDVEFFGGICPKLRHIRVVSATCKWSQVAFKGLESLDLSKVSFDSVGPILDIVRDIPQLKKLEICNCDVNDVVPTNTRSVSLPNLQFLRAEFDNKSGLISATEEFLKHISAPLQCSLYISVFGIDNEEASIVTAFCDWLLGRQTRAVLEGLERFQLGFDVSEGNMVDSVHFGLFSGSATIKGGIKAFGPQDVLHVLEYIKKMFQESHVSKPFTDLRLSKRGVELLAANEFFTLFKDHPPITRLELDEPVWYVWDASFDDVLGNPGSPFSTIRNLILRPNCGTSQTMTPDKIIDTVLSAMETARARTPLMSERQTELLACLELFVEEQNFNRVQPAVKALREDPRIGKVDLYVAL
ncbi:hypothetical protein FS837_009068 [Tulasnella sp. UAMH 9824]|nr:hypothetical protein FS837_009068 [Tulasnella sp. UAMH 9824]